MEGTMGHDPEDCPRTLCVYRPGVPVPGLKCHYAYTGTVPCTGPIRCLTCGGEQPEVRACPWCGTKDARYCDCPERVNCPEQGKPGHWQCGWCNVHHRPRFRCGCLQKEPPQE